MEKGSYSQDLAYLDKEGAMVLMVETVQIQKTDIVEAFYMLYSVRKTRPIRLA